LPVAGLDAPGSGTFMLITQEPASPR
jgi:hypothetical protein